MISVSGISSTPISSFSGAAFARKVPGGRGTHLPPRRLRDSIKPAIDIFKYQGGTLEPLGFNLQSRTEYALIKTTEVFAFRGSGHFWFDLAGSCSSNKWSMLDFLIREDEILLNSVFSAGKSIIQDDEELLLIYDPF